MTAICPSARRPTRLSDLAARALALALLSALLAGGALAAPAKGGKRRAPRPAPALVWYAETLDGAEVAARDPDGPINPASVVKVATTLWAIETLGPDARFLTRFLTRGTLEPKTGELHGDLVVVGGGDPDFQVENAFQVARALEDQGLKSVRGDLVLTHRFWIGGEGGSARREPDPDRRALIMGTRLREALDARRWRGPTKIAWRAMADRAATPLRAPRLRIAGKIVVDDYPAGDLEPLLSYRSRRLSETLHRFNCFSNNDIERVAENLGPAADLGAWLSTRWGLPAERISFETASGLGTNRLTPRLVVRLLRDLRATALAHGLDIHHLLPSAGCDPGTVENFFVRISSGPSGSVVGKTGTLTATDGGVSVFAGIAHTAGGEVLFCVAVPRAAGRLRQARRLEEGFVLDLLEQQGGPVARVCGPRLREPEEGAEIEAVPLLPQLVQERAAPAPREARATPEPARAPSSRQRDSSGRNRRP